MQRQRKELNIRALGRTLKKAVWLFRLSRREEGRLEKKGGMYREGVLKQQIYHISGSGENHLSDTAQPSDLQKPLPL